MENGVEKLQNPNQGNGQTLVDHLGSFFVQPVMFLGWLIFCFIEATEKPYPKKPE